MVKPQSIDKVKRERSSIRLALSTVQVSVHILIRLAFECKVVAVVKTAWPVGPGARYNLRKPTFPLLPFWMTQRFMPTACFAFNYCGVVVIAGRTLQPSVLCRRQPLSLGSIFKGECCFDGSCWLCKHTTLFPFTSFDHLYDVGFDSVILTKCFHYVACIHCWHQWLSWWAGNKLSVFERCRPPSVLDLQKPSDPHSRKEPRFPQMR